MLVWTGNWWALALRGGLAILLGIIAFALPGPTLAAIVILFGAYVTIDGVLIDRAVLRKRLPDFASEFEKMYKVYSRPSAPPATSAVNE